jgi:hypothetical protein
MAARKAPPAPTQAPEPVPERFYNLRRAAVWFDLADPDDPEDKRGQRWLRDGYNRPADGSKGRKFPGRYMSGQLVFSASNLVVIADIALEESDAKQQAKQTPALSTGRPRRLRTKMPALAASA